MSLRARIQVERDPFTLDVDIDAAPGETIGMVGPNGAGKSTFVRALAGLEPRARARIDVDGARWGRSMPPRERSVGVVFQELRLFPHLTVLDNVAFALRGRGVARARARREVAPMIARLGLERRAHARPAELSGGEAQRVALARALVRRPRVLLLDEPLAALDIGARRSMRSLLRDVLADHDGVAIVVSHDPVDVMTLADRIAVIEHGRCVQLGSPDEIRRRPASAYASELVGVNVFRGRLEALEAGAARLVTAGGELVVATHDAFLIGEHVLATLRPGDVSIHTERPAGSARNVISGRIASIAVGERVRVTLASAPPIVADLTVGSLRALGLAEGQEVFASFKATELTLAPA